MQAKNGNLMIKFWLVADERNVAPYKSVSISYASSSSPKSAVTGRSLIPSWSISPFRSLPQGINPILLHTTYATLNLIRDCEGSNVPQLNQ